MPCHCLPRLCLLPLVGALAACMDRSISVQNFGVVPPLAASYAWSGQDRQDGAPPAEGSRPSALRNRIDQALARKGYRQRPAPEAAWHLHYDLLVNPRIGTMTAGGGVLQSRMVCGLQDCQIRHEWRDADAPGYDLPRYHYREAVLRLVVVDARTQRVAWQASATREMDPSGPLDDKVLAAAAAQLADQLPEAAPAKAGAVSKTEP